MVAYRSHELIHIASITNAIRDEGRVDQLGRNLNHEVAALESLLCVSQVGRHRFKRFAHGTHNADTSRHWLPHYWKLRWPYNLLLRGRKQMSQQILPAHP
jgi:hypothetical protein